jgi:hypothetical protein
MIVVDARLQHGRKLAVSFTSSPARTARAGSARSSGFRHEWEAEASLRLRQSEPSSTPTAPTAVSAAETLGAFEDAVTSGVSRAGRR